VVVAGARRAGMVAVVLAALTMGLAFAHTLELPRKLDYDAATWTQLQHSLYRSSPWSAVRWRWPPSSPPWCLRCGPHRLRGGRLAAVGAVCFVLARDGGLRW